MSPGIVNIRVSFELLIFHIEFPDPGITKESYLMKVVSGPIENGNV